MLNKVIKHLKQGTLLSAINAKIFGQTRSNTAVVPSRFNITSLGDARNFLVRRTIQLSIVKPSSQVALIGDSGAHSVAIKNDLQSHGLSVDLYGLHDLPKLESIHDQNICCIIVAFPDSRRITKVARYIVKSAKYNTIPFEYMAVPNFEYGDVANNDVYGDMSFISPLLLYDIDIFAIYTSSLELFERKCQIRDYMDICQLIKMVLDNSVEGDIAEFGSYKGHSGYLIACLLDAMFSNKRLYMFDTFEKFPREEIGIDQFWSDTHQVLYDQVQKKFKNFSNVTLVKGDFTKTFDDSGIEKLSLVYVDCDSYRSIKYLLERIYFEVLADGGVMIFEDYGHPPLLGTRVAVHEFFDEKRDCIKFFSQFSGFYIVVKL